MTKQAKPAVLTNEEPKRLSVVLQNPSAEWSEIRAAMKAQGGGCTNLTVVSALSSNGNCGVDKKSLMKPENEDAAASADDDGKTAEENEEAVVSASASGDDKLMPLGNRRASLASQDSSNSGRPSQRGIRRQTSRRREFGRNGSRRFRLRSSVNSSIRSITLDSLNESSSDSLNNSSVDFNSSSMKLSGGLGFHDSVDIMDFGISQNGLRGALEESDRSCSSLDDGTLDDLQEECGDESRRELLLSWRSGSISKEKSRRDLLVSFRHDSTMSGFDDSMQSEGDLNSFVDSYGFLDWPAAKEEEEEEFDSDDILEGGDTNNTGELDGLSNIEACTRIQEGSSHKEHQHKEKEWNIEDYEGGDDSDQGHLPRNNSISASTMGLAVAKTLKRFSTTRRAFTESSTSSQGGMDLMKIKEALPTLIAKNRQQRAEVDENISKKKRAGSISVMGMFQQSLDAELQKDEKDTDQVTRRKPRKELIWARDSTNIGVNEEYKKLYAPAPKRKQRNSWNIFERKKSNESEEDF